MTAVGATLERASRAVAEHGAGGFARKATLHALRPALAPLAGRRLRLAAGRAGGIDALLDVACGCAPLGIDVVPSQVREEIGALLELLAAEPPRRLLEIGTNNGGTLFLFAHVAEPDATIVSVDLPRGEFGGGYPLWKVPLYRSFCRRRQHLELLRGDSHDAKMRNRVRNALRGEPLDFLFIDGDHSYDGVRRDFEDYGPLVRPGGLIAFHDIAPEGRGDGRELLGGDVARYWGEVSAGRESREFVASAEGFFGIGVIRA